MHLKVLYRKRLWLLPALLFICIVATFYSCKKTDVVSQQPSYAERFFSKPSGSDPELERIIKFFKEQNEETGFVDKLPENAGVPVWHKLIFEKPNNNLLARGIIADDKGNYLIPLSSDNQTLSALLFAMNYEGNYDFYCYNNDYAYQVTHNTNDYKIEQREYVMALFMSMSNYVFGIHKFKNIPNDLFTTLGSTPEDNGITKKMSLVPDKGTPPDIFTTDRVVGSISLCGFQFGGHCNCHGGYSTSSSDCEHPSSECPVDYCTVYKCILIIFEEENPPPGTGSDPSNPGSTNGGGTNGNGTGPLPPENSPQTSPNPPCSNCPWYTESQTEDPKLDCGPEGFAIGNQCVSPDNYPGKEEGLRYLWWKDEIFLSSYGGVDFGSWAIHYLVDNPNISFSTFQNWFMTSSEGEDGDYDAGYWDDPNLTFPSQNLPGWDDFNDAYPKHDDPLYDTSEEMYNSVGGALHDLYESDPDAYENTCALRVSKALNYSGINIPAGPNRYLGADGKYYFISAAALLKWMKITFGTPTGTNHLTGAQGGRNGVNFPNLLSGKKGIYIMIPNRPGGCETNTGFCASGHADLINNSECDGGCYFDAQVGGVSEIFIWELQ